MKKLIFIILGLCFLTSITLKSQTIVCAPSKLSEVQIIDSTAAWVGLHHNIGLESIYDSIYANYNYFYSLNNQDRLNTLTRYVTNYTYKLLPSLNIDTLSKFLKSVSSNFLSNLNSQNGNDSLLILIKVDSLYQVGVLSEAGRNCLLQLDSIFNNSTNANNAISSINGLIKKTENRYKKTSGITNKGELSLVLSIMYVGENSISYWSNQNNIEKWQNLESLPMLQASKAPPCDFWCKTKKAWNKAKPYAEADAYGVAAGLIGGVSAVGSGLITTGIYGVFH